MYSLFMVFENHRKSLIQNIASEASFVYILNGQKFITNAKMACGQTVLPAMSVLKGQKKVKMRHFG